MENDLANDLIKKYGIPQISLPDFVLDLEAVKMVTKELAMKYVLIPVNKGGKMLIVAMAEPKDKKAIEHVEFITNLTVEVVQSNKKDVMEAIEKHYG